MDVTQKQYIFESPYHSRVQLGREDPTAQQNDNTQQQSQELTQNTNTTAKEAQQFAATQTSEVEPKVTATESTTLLDTYA